MAKSDAVWGIDLGNSSLKALRCRPGSEDGTVEALAFDFIEYPKILTQPGAEAAELTEAALKQFLSRNDLRGDKVAISVSGQNGLARFIKLPPVEAKKIPDIVNYEAKQQIPFDLDDVVWDYQKMRGGSEEEGFALETEVGLFAMKRDQVYRSLEPFLSAEIEVDFVQLMPLALYNYMAFDQFHDLPPDDQYDAEDPPESVVVLSMGTDATDLVITNGYRVWQRSIPIGGNHFTRALTKDMKLTFAKAEHLKRNATAAEDPKAVFQAMRPVFNDLLMEIQRSIGYFTSTDRRAKIGRMVTLGNGMKLPGLRRYLSQNLGFDVLRIDSFRGVTGPEVLGNSTFQDNQLCFGACYGLVAQAMGRGSIITNLVPGEILKARMIEAKKPWAVAAAAAVLLGCSLSFAGYSRALSTVNADTWSGAEAEVTRVVTKSDGFKTNQSAAKGTFDAAKKTGHNLVDNGEGRIVWLEVLKAINECLPVDPEETRPEDISMRGQVFLEGVGCTKVDDLSMWFNSRKQWYEPLTLKELLAMADADADAGAEAAPADEEASGPTGEGWVFTVKGYHFHNQETPQENYSQGAQFLRETLLANLMKKTITLPKVDNAGTEEVSMAELGVGYPLQIDPGRPKPVEVVKGEAGVPSAGRMGSGGMGGDYMGGMEMGGMEMGGMEMGGMEMGGMEMEMGGMDQYGGNPGGGAAGPGAGAGVRPEEEEKAKPIPLLKFDFDVEFVWQKRPASVRHADSAKAALTAASSGEDPEAAGPEAADPEAAEPVAAGPASDE